MRLIVRLTLLAALAVQAFWALRLTRYDHALEQGKSRFESAEFPDALDKFESARSLWDRDAEIWSWVGYAAASVYRNPPKEGWTAEEQSEMLDLAWKAYAGAVLRCPMDSWSWAGLGQVALYQAERHDAAAGLDLAEIERRGTGLVDPPHAAALGAVKVAIRIEPSGYQAFDALGRIYESTGEVENAEEAYVQSARMMPAPSYHMWSYGRRLLPSLYQAVLKGLDEGIERAPVFDKSMLLLEVGRFARAQGDLETAEARLRAAIRSALATHYTYHALTELSYVYEEMGKLPEALDAITEAHRYPFDRAQVSKRMGTLELALQRGQEACRDLRDALREAESEVPLRLEAARACREAGDLDSAEQVLRDAQLPAGKDLVLERALFDLLRTTGRARAAEALARSWALELPDRPEFERWAEEAAGEAKGALSRTQDAGSTENGR